MNIHSRKNQSFVVRRKLNILKNNILKTDNENIEYGYNFFLNFSSVSFGKMSERQKEGLWNTHYRNISQLIIFYRWIELVVLAYYSEIWRQIPEQAGWKHLKWLTLGCASFLFLKFYFVLRCNFEVYNVLVWYVYIL